MKNLRKSMPSKKIWIMVSLAAALAAVAALGGVALGHDGGREDISARVAKILETDEQTVADAFSAAKAKQVDEALQTWLDKLVENGEITQEQADEFRSWYDDRPDGVPGLVFPMHRLHRGDQDVGADIAEILEIDEQTVSDAISQAVTEAYSEKLQERLDQAVKDGRLTQEQADAIAERLENGDYQRRRGHFAKGWKMGGRGLHRSGSSH